MDKKKLKLISGIAFCLASAVLFFFENDIPVPVKISLLIVGIALIAASKHRK